MLAVVGRVEGTLPRRCRGGLARAISSSSGLGGRDSRITLRVTIVGQPGGVIEL